MQLFTSAVDYTYLDANMTNTIKHLGGMVHCTGSRFIVPDPTDLSHTSDYDYLVHIPVGNFSQFTEFLQKEQFTWELKRYGFDIKTDNSFMSWRKDDINIILCMDIEFYENYVFCTNLAKKLELKTKKQRIDLFTSIREVYYNKKSFA